MEDERLERLESKLAHVELGVQQLDDTVIAQAAEIDELRRLCNELVTQLRALVQDRDQGEAESEPPAHY